MNKLSPEADLKICFGGICLLTYSQIVHGWE